jgi:all-trans-retinol 13,14-reductase
MDDVLVVGAGLGGLVLGAMLAKRGHRVTLVEQHYLAGGCATTFHRRQFRYEVSLHALDGMDADDPKMAIFHDLDVLDQVPFVHVPRSEFYRFHHPALDVAIPGSVDGAIESLSAAFPRERRAIRVFFQTIARIRRDLCQLFMASGWERLGHLASTPLRHPHLLRYARTSVAQLLDALFQDELLKLALVGNLLYYHDDPRKLSLFWYSLSQGSFLAGGVHFVKGGSQVLSDYLAQYIRQHGGEVLLGQTVEEILVRDGRAVGARFHKTLGSKRLEATRLARVVVVNAAVPLAVNQLIHAPEIAPYRARVNRLERSCSFLSLFLGFSTPPRALGNRTYSTLLPGDGVNHLDDMVTEFRSTDWSRKGFEFVDYSQLDHGLAPDGKSVGVISLVDYLRNWSDLDEDAYQGQKQFVTGVLLDRLERTIPGVRGSIEHCEMATPRTIVEYTGNPDGCIYGFRQDVQQAVPFRLGHRSPVKGLYFASAWVLPGGGYTGAMLAGMSCAREVHRALTGRALDLAA